MDVLGIGGPELLLLLFLAGVLLGPRRLAELARDVGKFIRQLQALTGDLTKQINREIDLLETAERKSSQSGKPEEPGAEAAGSAADQLPEAYRRFREDFPNEGKLDNLSNAAGGRHDRPGLPGQLAGTQGAEPPGGVSAAAAPASLSLDKD